jgi:hypothetical protein
MSDDSMAQTAMIVTPVIAVLLLALTVYLMPKIMGWDRLEKLFPDRPGDPVIARYNFQSLYIAKPGKSPPGPFYQGPVVLMACQNGLRIRIWKIFQPFSKPVFLPWEQITTRSFQSRLLPVKACSLIVGEGQPFTLTIIARVARKISNETNGKLAFPPELE